MNLYHQEPKKKFPVLLAYIQKGGKYLQAWCPFCVRWHLHGWGFGHRVAHCHLQDSPFKETGYVLKAADRKVAQRAKEAEAELVAQNR